MDNQDALSLLTKEGVRKLVHTFISPGSLWVWLGDAPPLLKRPQLQYGVGVELSQKGPRAVSAVKSC